ncbi:hypothetical protein WA1_41300 [Scytonema hofmannii PCC 7110]|uniref:Uncharacterized protein n=2 Tax=Scytonema hofmannii TaxID=34078 RepID=A0A139WUR8_9CYAN|nr:hypothetical protein WA1_41300 [Scytonema hofmannii PCC 7110]
MIYIEQCDLNQYKPTMQITTSGIKSKNIIGQRYEVISTPTQTSSKSNLVSNIPNLKIQVFIESSLSEDWSSQLNQNSILLIKCLTILQTLFTTSPEGLQEASEALETILEYYQENQNYLQQTNLSKELGAVTGNVLPSVVRPPLVIDFE